MEYPSHLVPVELEKELISGALRAAWIADENTSHAGAQAALALVQAFDARALAIREHREIVAAIQWLIRSDGAFSPALVRDELRERGQLDALHMLPSLVDWGLAPVAALPVHVRKIQAAARARARWRRAQSIQVELLERAGRP
jgi:hypothetical protein